MSEYTKRDRSLVRPSLYDKTQHRLDDLKNQGFKYHGNLFKRSVSPILFTDGKRSSIIEKLDLLMAYLIDYVKEIKKSYNYTIGRKDKNIN